MYSQLQYVYNEKKHKVQKDLCASSTKRCFCLKKFLQCFQQWIVNTELPIRWYFTFSTHPKLLFSVHLMCLLEKIWSEKRESLFFCLNESEEKIYIHIVVLWCMKIRGNYLTLDVLATLSMRKRSILTSALAPIYHAL